MQREVDLIAAAIEYARQEDRKQIADLEAQLADEKQTWRCFHCGFETSDRKEASGHFGEFGEEYPLCIHWSDLDADGKASEFQSINAELEGEREENLKLRQQVEQLEYLTGSQEADISSRFKGCRTINEAFFKYDSMEGRALAAEARIAALEAALQEIAEVCDGGDGEVDLWLNDVGFRRDMLADYRLAYKKINKVGKKLEQKEAALQVAREALEKIKLELSSETSGPYGRMLIAVGIIAEALASIEEVSNAKG